MQIKSKIPLTKDKTSFALYSPDKYFQTVYLGYFAGSSKNII